MAASGANGIIAGAEALLPKVGNTPGVLRLATARRGMASSITGRRVSLPNVMAVISTGGKSRGWLADSMLVTDVFSPNDKACLGAPASSSTKASHPALQAINVVIVGPKAKEMRVLLHVGAVAGFASTSLGGRSYERLGVHVALLTT
jgi:hypothetical protein